MKVITLCGSIKFQDDFEEICSKLTLQGNVVLMPNFLKNIDRSDITKEMKEMLDKIHKRKIDMSDEIFVINKDRYIGDSTRSEIEYAKKLGKIVKYLEN